MAISDLPVRLREIAEEDKKTYRRWARISFTFYVGLIAGLLVIGFWTRRPEGFALTEKETARSGSIAKPALHPHPGG